MCNFKEYHEFLCLLVLQDWRKIEREVLLTGALAISKIPVMPEAFLAGLIHNGLNVSKTAWSIAFNQLMDWTSQWNMAIFSQFRTERILQFHNFQSGTSFWGKQQHHSWPLVWQSNVITQNKRSRLAQLHQSNCNGLCPCPGLGFWIFIWLFWSGYG